MNVAAPAANADRNRTLLAALLATVAMLFTAIAAAYLERKATTSSWSRIAFPGAVWWGVGALFLASASAEVARRTGRRAFLVATVAVGALFLALQLLAWGELRARGIFLPTSPHASFFYMLSAVHGVHVLAALAALGAALARPAIRGLCIGFWHFMGGVWLYALLVLTVL